MYLSAVLLPPLAQREEVARLLADLAGRMDAPVAESRRRWGRSRPSSPPAGGAPAGRLLTPLPVGLMGVHVTKFGYVEPEAGTRLRTTLERDALGWTAPTVHVTGELRTHGSDERLHLALDGDVDGLRQVFRDLTDSAKRAGFMLDRRTFVPLLPVADLDDGVSDAALGTLVAGLEDFVGTPWPVAALTLVRLGFGSGDELTEVATIPIGAPVG